MILTRVSIDNKLEREAYPKQAELKIEDYLLPIQTRELTIGEYTTEAYELKEEPPLFKFARQRNQIITIQTTLLTESPVNIKAVY